MGNFFVSYQMNARPSVAGRSSIALGVAIALLASALGQAAESRSPAEIQAEIDQLKQQLERKEKELSEAGNTANTGAVSTPKPAERETETSLDKVVVRARNRLEPLQDVPLSISVVAGKELDRLHATDIKEVLQRTGNVQWNQGNQRTSSLSIRGIGKIGQTEAQDPSVGVIVDGVNYAYNALTSSYDFIDVDSVEVTRGPQGTLLGKNTSVGVISINSRKPSFTSSADYSFSYGQRDYLSGWVAGGGAVVDNLLAWRGTLGVTKSQGYVTNLYNRDNTYTSKDRLTGRLQFLLTPNENLTARLILERTPRAGETTNGLTIRTPTPATFANGAANSTTNESRLSRGWFTQQQSFTVNGTYLYGAGQNAVDYATQRPVVTGSNGVTLQLDQHLEIGDITSISAYKDFHFNAVNDTGVPFDVTRNSGGFYNDYKQWSQELRFNSRIGDLVDYQTGVFFLKVINHSLYQRVYGDDAGAWFASNPQYDTLRLDGPVATGNPSAAGLYLLRNSLAGLSLAPNQPTGYQDIRNTSKAIFLQANWHITEPFTLTTGVRVTREDRQNTGSTFIRDSGSGVELNPDVVNGVSLGGFGSDANGNLLASNSVAQIALANATAYKYFGVANYAGLNAWQKRQVAAGKAIRAGQVGTVFNPIDAEPFKATQPAFVVSPTYKINDDWTAFVSWQYGEKPGISQFLNAISRPVKAEKNNDFEAGFKSLLLDHKLTFNATAFLMNIKNYEQSLSILDPIQTAATGVPTFVQTTGNVPKVQVKGVEIDSVFVGIPNTTIRLSTAYNDARYKDFKNSPQPVENGNLTGAAAQNDVSGQTLAGAAKVTGNLGVDYRIPVSQSFEFHTSANAAYTGRYNSDPSLSSYAWIPSNTIVDAAIGLGRRDQRFDATLLVKNAFDNNAPLLRTWNTYTPAVPRWYYVQFTGHL